jgi:hypothetical protein
MSPLITRLIPFVMHALRLALENRYFKDPARLLHVKALFKAIHTSAAVDQLLLAGEERVTFGANFNLQLRFHGASFECLTAHATNGRLAKFGMDFFLHAFSPLLRML